MNLFDKELTELATLIMIRNVVTPVDPTVFERVLDVEAVKKHYKIVNLKEDLDRRFNERQDELREED